MILVDTSVWINHLRYGRAELADLLANGLVLVHPFVRGELACGNVRNREKILSDLVILPQSQVAPPEEVLEMIDRRKLFGRGLGWTDVNMLASALIERCELWTEYNALRTAARHTGLNCFGVGVPHVQ